MVFSNVILHCLFPHCGISSIIKVYSPTERPISQTLVTYVYNDTYIHELFALYSGVKSALYTHQPTLIIHICMRWCITEQIIKTQQWLSTVECIIMLHMFFITIVLGKIMIMYDYAMWRSLHVFVVFYLKNNAVYKSIR